MNKLDGESSMMVVSGAAPNDRVDGMWIVTSSREVQLRSDRSAPSRKCGTVNVSNCGASEEEGRRKLSYNGQYSGCGLKASTSNGRRTLGPGKGLSKRWVHRRKWKKLNSHVAHKCCQHFTVAKPSCGCER